MNIINNLEKSFLNNDLKNDTNQAVNFQIKEISNKSDIILCDHCGRTANNGIRCLGMCVADSDY